MNFYLFEASINKDVKQFCREIYPSFVNFIHGQKVICTTCGDRFNRHRFSVRGFLAGINCRVCHNNDFVFWYGRNPGRNRNLFNSFYDNSTGQTISSLEQIHTLEKSGKVFMKPSEASRVFAENKYRINKEANKRIRAKVESAVNKTFDRVIREIRTN